MVYFTQDNFSYVFFKKDSASNENDSLKKVTITWSNENRFQSTPYGEEESAEKVNYYLPQCSTGCENLPIYKRLNYSGIYESIDLQVYSNNNTLKYYFITHQEGNPNYIELTFEGQDELIINENYLVLKVFDQYIYLESPIAYQIDDNNNVVPLGWKPVFTDNGGGKVGFSFGSNSYNSDYKLVYQIGAPQSNFKSAVKNLDWSISVDQAIKSEFHDIEVSNSGEPYIGGCSFSTNFPVTNAYQGINAGGKDFIFMKFNSNGQIVWSTYYGGSEEDGASGNYNDVGVSLNSSNELFFEGTTFSDDIILKELSGSYFDDENLCGGFSCVDQIVGKISSSGQLLWATYFGGEPNSHGGDIVVDQNNDIFLTGAFGGTLPWVDYGGNAYFNNSSSNRGYLVKFSSTTLNIDWCTGFDAGWPKGIAIDNSNRLLVTGWAVDESTIFDMENNTGNPSAYSQSYGGGIADNFIVRFNTDLSVNWGSYIGGSGRDIGSRIVVNSKDVIAIIGESISTNFPICSTMTNPTITTTMQGGSYAGDMTLTTFNDDGVIQNSTYFGSENDEMGLAIASNIGGNLFIGGMCGSNTGMPFQLGQSSLLYSDVTFADDPDLIPQVYDGFIAGYKSNFMHEWSSYIGGSGNNGAGLDVIAAGKCYDNYLYFVGTTFSTTDFSDYVGRSGAFNGSGLGGALLMRFNMEGTPLPVKKNEEISKGILIYPNYVNDILHLKNIDNNQIKKYSIYNNNGVLLNSGKGNVNQEVININFQDFLPGLYFIRVETENTMVCEKVIKL